MCAVKGKEKGFKGPCCHCQQYEHRLSECPQKDKDMGKTVGGDRQSWQTERGGNKRQCGPQWSHRGGKQDEGKGGWSWPWKGQWSGPTPTGWHMDKGLRLVDDSQHSVQPNEDNVFCSQNSTDVNDLDTSTLFEDLELTIQPHRIQYKTRPTIYARQGGRWCSKNRHEVLTTDGERCSDYTNDEVWPKCCGKQSARKNDSTKCEESLEEVGDCRVQR